MTGGAGEAAAIAPSSPPSAGGDPLARETSPRAPLRIMAAGAIGNLLEWYDFAAYGFLAATFARNFFPGTDPLAAQLSAFGVFAASFLMRPVGAVVMGHVGDRHGRGRALLLSVVLMTLSTVGIGLLPTHATAGALAPVLLLLLRLMQGVAVGGEYTTSAVFLAENAPPERRGFVTALAMAGCQGGTLLGSGVGALTVFLLPPDALLAFGWRIPFLLGAVLGIVAFVLRRSASETPRAASGRPPLARAIREAGGNILRASAVTFLMGADFYLLFVYLPTYLEQVAALPPARALAFNTASMLVLVAGVLFWSALSDRIGRKRVAGLGLGALIVCVWPLFLLLRSGEPAVVLAAQMGLAVIVSAASSPMPAFLAELFEAPVRCTAMAISWNLAIGISGGTAPMIATYFVTGLDAPMAPAVHLMGLAAIAALALWSMPERRGRALDAPAESP